LSSLVAEQQGQGANRNPTHATDRNDTLCIRLTMIRLTMTRSRKLRTDALELTRLNGKRPEPHLEALDYSNNSHQSGKITPTSIARPRSRSQDHRNAPRASLVQPLCRITFSDQDNLPQTQVTLPFGAKYWHPTHTPVYVITASVSPPNTRLPCTKTSSPCHLSQGPAS
jgi:hypothetical protein